MFAINTLTSFLMSRYAATLDPEVDIQPTIVTFPISLNENLKAETPKAKNLMGIPTNRALMLEFSVNYLRATKNIQFLISKRFALNETKVILKKYKKKGYSRQMYVEALDEPKIIILPTNKDDILGFYFYIARSTVLRDFNQLRKGSQLFSLYTDKDRETSNTAGEVKATIGRFRELLKIKNSSDSQDWGFRFHIQIKSKKEEIKTIFTNMFEIVFEEYSVQTKKVETKGYHFGIEDTKISEISEVQQPEDKKFCCIS